METPLKLIIDDVRKEYEMYMDALTAPRAEHESVGGPRTDQSRFFALDPFIPFKSKHGVLIKACNQAEKSIHEITQRMKVAETTAHAVDPNAVEPAPVTEECNKDASPALSDFDLDWSALKETVQDGSSAQQIVKMTFIIRKVYSRYIDALTAVWDEYVSAGWKCTAVTDSAVKNFKQEHKTIISTFNNVEKFIHEINHQLVIKRTAVRPADAELREANAEPREYLESDAQDGRGDHLTEECNMPASPAPPASPASSDLNMPEDCGAHHE